jgi:hypothetical protein
MASRGLDIVERRGNRRLGEITLYRKPFKTQRGQAKSMPKLRDHYDQAT